MIAFLKTRWKNILITATVVSVVLAGGWLYGNFHTVNEGTVFRSAQLTPVGLWFYARHFNIRSIVNLQGSDPKSYWYREELKMAAELGVEHIDYKLSALREISVQEADDLVQTIARAPKPVLVHCSGGADRSGLASALWLYATNHVPAEEAAKQLSIYYGHVPMLSGGTAAMDRSFWNYVAAKGKAR